LESVLLQRDLEGITPDTIGYINAGGRGTRLNGIFTPDRQTGIAKALLAIGEPPIRLIDHHIANLQQQGGYNSSGRSRMSMTFGFRSVDELDAQPDYARQVLVSGDSIYRGNDR
jgi:hypothetical protein